jgi:hypothetical protein
MHEAQRHQAVDRLDRVDGVAAGDRNAGRAQTEAPPSRMRPMVCDRQHVDRHAHQRQRQDRRAAHRIDVADRIGGGDAPEVEGVVDDGHEEVGGGDQRLLVVQPVDRGVVGGLDADQQLGRHREGGRALQDLGQHAGGDLAAAATAVD